jgi:hypothetical protein
VLTAYNKAVDLGRRINLLTYADWTPGANWSNPSNEIARHTPGSTVTISQVMPIKPTTEYEVTFTISNHTVGSVRPIVGAGGNGSSQSANGTFTETITSGTTTTFRFEPSSPFDGDIDLATVSVQQTDIAASSTFPGPELLDQTNGVMDKDNWTAGNNANLTNPSVGILRVARIDTANPQARQVTTTIGKRYIITGEARTDGVSLFAQVRDGGAVGITVATTNVFTQFKVEYTATSTSFRLQTLTSTGTEYSEWRNISVREANPLNGDHSGVTVGVAGNGRGIRYAVEDDGAATYTGVYSAELNSMFNPDRGTLIAWARVANAGVWTDGTNRYICSLQSDASNRVLLFKSSNNNSIIGFYQAGGTTKQLSNTSMTTTDLFMLTLTWDTTADNLEFFVNSVSQGIQSGLGVWVGNLSSTGTTIGAATTTPTLVWNGVRTEVSLYDQPLTQSELTAQWQAGN